MKQFKFTMQEKEPKGYKLIQIVVKATNIIDALEAIQYSINSYLVTEFFYLCENIKYKIQYNHGIKTFYRQENTGWKLIK